MTYHKYEVFFDYTGLASGDFETNILENIHARAHFLVLLTPSALNRCDAPGDLVRCEVEAALDSRRNIVPLMMEGFSFDRPSTSKKLTGKLALLRRYNAITVTVEYFEAAMAKLRERFLNVPRETVLHPASPAARQVAAREKRAAAMAPAVTQNELVALQWFERGLDAGNLDEKVQNFSEAIRLKPDYVDAFIGRGNAHFGKRENDLAVEDYNQVLQLEPGNADAFYNRGLVRYGIGDFANAIDDYTRAIGLKPDDADAFYNRALAHQNKREFAEAIEDYTQATLIKPGFSNAFCNLGVVRKAMGDLKGALTAYNEALRIQPGDPVIYYNRAAARRSLGDLGGARDDLDQAVHLKPDYANALANRANIRSAQSAPSLYCEPTDLESITSKALLPSRGMF